MDKAITAVYSQAGGDLPYFVGKQYGGGWLRTLARFAFPILKRVVGVATNTVEDVVVNKKKFMQSFKDNASNELKNYMSGRGLAAPSINRPRKRARSTKGTIFEK